MMRCPCHKGAACHLQLLVKKRALMAVLDLWTSPTMEVL